MATLSVIGLTLGLLSFFALGYFYGWRTRGTVESIKQTRREIEDAWRPNQHTKAGL